MTIWVCVLALGWAPAHHPTHPLSPPRHPHRHRPPACADRDGDDRRHQNSRSTARLEEERFGVEGTADRRARLHTALAAIGVDADELTESPDLQGSAALRTYTSFVHPRSAGGLANAEKPQRAATIANSIAFLLKEQRAVADEWLCNHDRALSELPADRPPHPLVIVLDNLRSAANTGNMLRAAEAARVRHVYCCGMTPTPPDAKVLKTAVGSAAYVPHSHVGSTLEAVRRLKAEGVTVWAAETTARSVRYDARALRPWPRPLAIVFGNEVIGVDTEVQEECDALVCLPCHGVKNSLNVATACSVFLWEALRQWEEAVEVENGVE